MKLMIADIDCTETVKEAYQEACAVISLPEYEKVAISVYNGRGNVYARGGRNENGYLIKFNGHFYGASVDGMTESEVKEAIATTTKHESIHVHQVYVKQPVKHNAYFLESCQKLGINSENKYSTDEVIKEKQAMKNEVGMINIEQLKAAAASMSLDFETFLEKTGMKSIVEKAAEVQTKEAEKEKAEKEKADFELLKAKVEKFSLENLRKLNEVWIETQASYKSEFSDEERVRIDFENIIDRSGVKFSMKLKGIKREGGTRTSNGQSKWKLYIDDEEIDGVPEDSEFMTAVEECKNRWNWLYYEICKAKRPDDIPTFVFSRRTSLAGVAGLYKNGTKDFDWKAAARDGRLAERIGIDLEKEVRIEEVEKAA